MAQVTEAASRQIVQKISCPPPIGRPLKTSPPKVEKRKYGTELRSYHYASFYADLREISVPRAKIHIFLYRGLTWGGVMSQAIHFWNALVEPMLRPIWHITLRLTVFETSKFGIFGPLGGTPIGETLCPGPICTLVQNFTPIRITTDLINIRQMAYTCTCVAFVDNKVKKRRL